MLCSLSLPPWRTLGREVTPFGLQRRRLLFGGGIAACGLLTGCELSLRDGLFNACLAELPEDLREHPLITAAWKGLDATKVWDTHCHVFGNGDSGSDLWFNPLMEEIWRPTIGSPRLRLISASILGSLKWVTDFTIALARLDGLPDLKMDDIFVDLF